MRPRAARDVFLDIELRRGRCGATCACALREAIQDGRLAAGTRLPSSRRLATDLQVSRGVVADTYDQLAAEGYLAVAATTGAAGRRGRAPPTPLDRSSRNARPGRSTSSPRRRTWSCSRAGPGCAPRSARCALRRTRHSTTATTAAASSFGRPSRLPRPRPRRPHRARADRRHPGLHPGASTSSRRVLRARGARTIDVRDAVRSRPAGRRREAPA